MAASVLELLEKMLRENDKISSMPVVDGALLLLGLTESGPPPPLSPGQNGHFDLPDIQLVLQGDGDNC